MIWITGSTAPQLSASSARQRFPMESHLCRDVCLGIICLFPRISKVYLGMHTEPDFTQVMQDGCSAARLGQH
jgi:hypothetical protein